MKKTISFLASVNLALLAFSASASAKVLASFEKGESAKAWASVNDDVMGGVSSGGFKLTDEGTLLFSGSISLKNNGGFASIRARSKSMDLSEVSAIEVEVKGDGRTYWVELRDNKQMMASSYRAYMETKAGEWQKVTVPLEDFKLQAFGMAVRGSKIDLKNVTSFGFTLADKKEGPFKMELKSIKAVTKNSDAKESPTAKAGKAAKSGNTIVDLAKGAGTFKTLLAAAVAADLAEALSGEGPFTVFAPTDEAFAKLPKGTVEGLLKPENKEALADILKYHVISGRVNLSQALEAQEAPTLQGQKLAVKFEKGRVRIGSAELLSADLEASNGLVHVIGDVLLPPKAAAQSCSPCSVGGAMSLIERAVETGAPIFNKGDAASCAAIYEITTMALRSHPEVSEENRALLGEVLNKAQQNESKEEQAWILRKGMGQVYRALQQK